MKQPRYTIVETDSGPMVPESRVSVYDVLELYREGDTIYEIGSTYNLSPLQVETAVAYIDKHRERLETELEEILVRKAARERHYRAIAAEIVNFFWPKISVMGLFCWNKQKKFQVIILNGNFFEFCSKFVPYATRFCNVCRF